MFTTIWNRLELIGATEGLNKELVHNEFLNWLADLHHDHPLLTEDDVAAFILRRSKKGTQHAYAIEKREE